MKFNSEHHEVILTFAEKHPEIITNKHMGPQGYQNNKVLWEQLKDHLNSLGYGNLTVNEYKKVSS